MEKEKEKKPQPAIRSVSIDEWRTLYPESESHKYDFIPVRAFITKMGINPITFRRRSDRGDIIAVHWPEKAPGSRRGFSGGPAGPILPRRSTTGQRPAPSDGK